MTTRDLVVNLGFWGTGGVATWAAFTKFGFGVFASIGIGIASAFGMVIVLLGLAALLSAVFSGKPAPPK